MKGNSVPTYVVERVEQGNTFETQHGSFQSWCLAITDGEKQMDAELNTKIGKDGPTIGERIEGELTKGQYGWKLKRSYSQNGGGGRGYAEDPKKSAEIRRMASQKAAIALLAAEVAAGLTFKDEKASELLKPRIDFFERDTIAAGEGAS